MKRYKICKAVCIIAIVLITTMKGNTLSQAELLPQVAQQALLKGKWSEVLTVLEHTELRDATVPCRIVAAHSYLAMNRNNEAIILFLSIDKDDVELWKTWTYILKERNPEAAVAHYLYGDALIRGGDFNEGLNSFNQAIEIDPRESLFWTARGVAKAIHNDLDDALLDINYAIGLRRDYADAHASIGTLWVLQNAAPGAIEAFNRALNINPSFALAYNGRACAQFGEGSYEKAVDDFEKCYELCPALFQSGVNQSFVLAAIESETLPDLIMTEKPGTTIMTRSELAKVDCSKFNTYSQIVQYEDSVRVLAKTDVPEALRVLSTQRAGISQSRERLASDLNRFIQLGKKVTDAENRLRSVDNFLGMVPVSGIKATIVSDNGWKVPLDITGKAAGLTASITETGTGLNMWANVASRTATPEIATGFGTLKAVTRVSTYLLSEGLYVPHTIADARSMEAAARINFQTIQNSRLQQIQGEVLAEGIRQKVDFGKIGLPGVGTIASSMSNSNPLREYRIPASAQITAFATMPGATGKSIALSGQKSFVLLDGGELTDPLRLGSAIRGYEALGAQTIPVPKGTDPTRFMNVLGLSSQNTILMKVTAGSDPQWSPYKMPTTASSPPPGGVTTESRPRIDRGDWPVMTSFSLAYNPKLFEKDGSNKNHP